MTRHVKYLFPLEKNVENGLLCDLHRHQTIPQVHLLGANRPLVQQVHLLNYASRIAETFMSDLL